jgi:hypothetical protein
VWGKEEQRGKERVMYITPIFGYYESHIPDRRKRKNLSAMVDSSNP